MNSTLVFNRRKVSQDYTGQITPDPIIECLNTSGKEHVAFVHEELLPMVKSVLDEAVARGLPENTVTTLVTSDPAAPDGMWTYDFHTLTAIRHSYDEAALYYKKEYEKIGAA